MKRLFILLSILTITISLNAQWTLNMQQGGNVFSIIEVNNKMFVGTQFGVYKSDDYGVSWNLVNNGLGNTVVHVIMEWNDTLCAGTEDGVYISSNYGANWTASNTGMVGQKVNSLLLTKQGLYAGTDAGGIFFTNSLNTSWITKNNGITNLKIKSLAIQNSRLLAGSYGAGLFVSDDNGNTWSVHNAGLVSWFIRYILVNDNRIFISSDMNFCVSNNSGNSWSVLTTPFGATVLCGIASNDTLLVGTDGDGVAYSYDNGVSWSMWNDGLSNKNIYALANINNNYWAACCCGYGLFNRGVSEITNVFSHQTADAKATIFNIYPTPTSSSYTISIDKPYQNCILEMYDYTGKLISKELIQKFPFTKNVKGLKAGLYLLNISKNNKLIVTKKLIVE